MKIAVSGLSGCGNTTVSKLVAEKLGLTYVNYTLRNLSEDTGTSFQEIREKAEKEFPKIDLLLDKKLIELSSADNVVTASRLAVWLADADLCVWLHATPQTRAKRIAKREGSDWKKVLAETKERDAMDSARYKKLYGINRKKFVEAVDLVINTESISAEKVAEAIACAAKQLPFKENKKRKRIARKLSEFIKLKLG